MFGSERPEDMGTADEMCAAVQQVRLGAASAKRLTTH